MDVDSRTKELALCGMMAAAAVVLLCLGGLVPLATYACPILASLAMLPPARLCRRAYAWCCWAAAAALGLLLGPDKEIALLFAAFGCYPLLKPRLDALRPAPARWGAKLGYALAAAAAVYALLLFVLASPEAQQAFFSAAWWTLAATAALGVVVFFLFDWLLERMGSRFLRRR